jgi:vesicle coat complex subunit
LTTSQTTSKEKYSGKQINHQEQAITSSIRKPETTSQLNSLKITGTDSEFIPDKHTLPKKIKSNLLTKEQAIGNSPIGNTPYTKHSLD